jgi:iron complex outermembrane receptor protein
MSALPGLLLALSSGIPDAGANSALTDSVQGEFAATRVAARRRPSSLEDLLEEVPGLSLVRRGPSAAEPVYRAAGPHRLLVRLDGARVQGACTDHMDPAASYADLEDLDHPLLASGSSLGGGSFGTLDLPMKRPRLEGLSWTAATLVHSSERRARTAGGVSYGRPDWGASLTGSLSEKDDTRLPGNLRQPLTDETKVHATGRLEWRPLDGHEVSLRGLLDESREIGYPALPMDASLARVRQGATGWSFEGDLVSASVDAWANQVVHEMDDTRRDSVPMHMDMPGEASTIGSRGRLEASREAWTLSGSFERWRTFQRAEMTMYPNDGGSEMFLLTWPDVRTDGTAGTLRILRDGVIPTWAEASLEGRNLSLTSELGRTEAGILKRGAPVERDFLAPGASAGIGWDAFVDSFALALSWNRRAPDAEQLWGYWLFRARDNRDQLGEPDLGTEATTLVEATWVREDHPFHARSTLWVSRTDDAIETDTDPTGAMTPGAAGTVRWGNRGTWWRAGGDLDLTFHLSRGVLWGRASLVRSRGPGDREGAQTPPPSASVGLLHAIHGPFSGRIQLDGALPQTWPDATENERRTEGWLVPELAISGLHRQGVRWRWEVALVNPLDQTWRRHLDWGQAPRPGRGIAATLRVEG